MTGKLRSLFRREPTPAATAPPTPPGPAEATGDVEAVLADLIGRVCECSPDPLRPADVDPTLHMYDAGYVNSITGAELLVHIEKCYGLFIPETELVGRLCSLRELAQHIAAAAG